VVESLTGKRLPIGAPGFGTNKDSIVGALRGLGWYVTEGEAWDLEDLKYHLRRHRYIIANIASAGYSHWVIVWKIARGRVYLQDPERGEIAIPWPLWVQVNKVPGWEGYSIACTKITNRY